MTEPSRDELIIVAMNAFADKMDAEPSLIFEDSAAIVDALLERFDIIPKVEE